MKLYTYCEMPSGKNGSSCYFFIKKFFLLSVIFICFQLTGMSQSAKYTRPSWWFGAAGGVNFNFYSGSTHELNGDISVTTPFEKGRGIGAYAAPQMEFHPYHAILGFLLQVGLDNRRAEFKQGSDEFKPRISYFAVEPSLRISPFTSNFYVYAGPRFGFLLSTSFTYKTSTLVYPDKTANPDAKAYMSSMKKKVVSFQVGMGYDIPITPRNKQAQWMISPFVAFHPSFGQNIRTIEKLNVTTFRAGIAIKAGRGHKILTPIVQPLPVVEIKDRDGDGIIDSEDRCPDQPGSMALRGCPDRDGDAIADIDDKCADTPGLNRYDGCPIPDTDKDGINDEEDKCPTVPGLARYQGCPIPDTDKDGVNDEEDKCINEAGPASNFGCPLIPEVITAKVNKAAKNIFFATGSFKLLPKSFKSLNEVVTILNQNPTFNVDIDGHTDEVGNDAYNQTLSDNRAASVKEYLVSKGIAESRLTSAGYGETKPVADNKTVAGRAQNRRVEMNLRNYK